MASGLVSTWMGLASAGCCGLCFGHSTLNVPDLISRLQTAVSAEMLLALRQLCALTVS